MNDQIVRDAERQYAEIDTLDIAYRQWGNHGKPVVLLHGIPMNSSLWHQTGTELAKHNYRVYAPEILGLGYSKGMVDYDHSLPGQAHIIIQFIRTVVGEPCILVGHDIGGGIAQIVMANRPELIKRCVLTNCVAFDSWPVEGVQKLVAAAQGEAIYGILTLEFVAGFLQKGLTVGVNDKTVVTPELIQDIAGGLIGTNAQTEHFVRFLKAMNSQYTQEVIPKLQRSDIDTLVVWAWGDIFQPLEVGKRLSAALPRRRMETIEGGHFHPLESLELARLLMEWAQ